MIDRKRVTVTLNSRIDGDEHVNIYSGEYAFRDGAHLITYTDYTGNGITRNGIQANDSAMLLHRVGEFEGDMLFDPKMDTVVKYTAGGWVQTGFILHTEGYGAKVHDDRVEIHIRYPEFTAEVTRASGEVLGIPAGNVYIKYEDITAWGVGGQYIDRSYFR